jgi:hypothetical protein
MNSNNSNHEAAHSFMETDHDIDLFDISDWNTQHPSLAVDRNSSLQPQQQGLSPSSPHSRHSQSNSPLQPRLSQSSQSSEVDNFSNSNMMNNSSFAIKKPIVPSITTIYEPKFFEIFQAYQSYCYSYEPSVKFSNLVNQHLMTLCLNHLLSFSNWARETNNALFIRLALFENPDMRPEVRNGLAMILVYVFAAAKANEMRILNTSSSNVDMFTVLMKTDTGLGIANKTSLKIYSDPYEFFHFLKVCYFSSFQLTLFTFPFVFFFFVACSRSS